VVYCIGYQSHVAAAAEEEYQEQCENQHTSLSVLVTWQGEESLDGHLVDIRGLDLMQSAPQNHRQH